MIETIEKDEFGGYRSVECGRTFEFPEGCKKTDNCEGERVLEDSNGETVAYVRTYD